MSRYVTVEVTAEDIAKGKGGQTDACPIALACRRVGYPAAHVGYSGWSPNGTDIGHPWPVGPLPEEARRFVVDFDQGSPVKPATFRLPLP